MVSDTMGIGKGCLSARSGLNGDALLKMPRYADTSAVKFPTNSSLGAVSRRERTPVARASQSPKNRR